MLYDAPLMVFGWTLFGFLWLRSSLVLVSLYPVPSAETVHLCSTLPFVSLFVQRALVELRGRKRGEREGSRQGWFRWVFLCYLSGVDAVANVFGLVDEDEDSSTMRWMNERIRLTDVVYAHDDNNNNDTHKSYHSHQHIISILENIFKNIHHLPTFFHDQYHLFFFARFIFRDTTPHIFLNNANNNNFLWWWQPSTCHSSQQQTTFPLHNHSIHHDPKRCRPVTCPSYSECYPFYPVDLHCIFLYSDLLFWWGLTPPRARHPLRMRWRCVRGFVECYCCKGSKFLSRACAQSS